MPLEQSDIALLTRQFPLERHEFLKGMTYITEDAITERLDEVDPAWQFLVTNIIQRGSTVVVTARMEVKGIVREGVGMEKIQSKEGGYEVNEAEKSAATDALKRCARLFGIGRYLLRLSGEVKDMATLAAWFKKHSTGTNGNGNGQQQDMAGEPLRITGVNAVKIVHKDDKKWVEAGGVKFFSREPWRKAGYETDGWDKPGVYSLKDFPFTVFYKVENGYKNGTTVVAE